MHTIGWVEISKFNDHVDLQTTTTIFRGDSRNVVQSDSPITTNDADIVITSPPYGDHQTTVAYGEFSTDSAIIAENRDYGVYGASLLDGPPSAFRRCRGVPSRFCRVVDDGTRSLRRHCIRLIPGSRPKAALPSNSGKILSKTEAEERGLDPCKRCLHIQRGE